MCEGTFIRVTFLLNISKNTNINVNARRLILICIIQTVFQTYLSAAQVSTTPHCHYLPLGDWIASSGITFGWLQDVLLTHVHGVVILLAHLI